MMHWIDTYVQPIAGWITQHPLLGTLAVFLLALSESLPAFGAIVPGTSIILAVAGLAGLGYLSPLDVLVAACLGAIVGDAIAYLFGQHYREQALSIWPLSRYPQMVAASDAFFRKHGGKSILIARFAPGVRAFVPMIAGISGMPAVRFFAANTSSAVVWAASHVGTAAAAGATLAALHQVSGRLVAVLAALIVLAMTLTLLMRRGITLGSRMLVAARNCLHAATLGREGRLFAVVRALTDPKDGAAREVALLGVVTAISGVALFNLIQDVLAHGELARADQALSTLVGGWRTAWGDSIMVVVTSFGDTPVTALVALLAAAWIFWHGERRLALGFVAALSATALFFAGLNATMQIPRPSSLYAGGEAFGFPSSHITFAATLYGILGWIWSRHLPRHWSTVLIAGLSTLVASVSLSRIYLQAHWPSDVAAGLVFGFALTSVFATVFRHAQIDRIKPRLMLLATGATFAVVGVWHASASYTQGLAVYAPQSKKQLVSIAQWLDGAWQQLPARRVDLAGEREQPILLQWGGTADDLAKVLWPHGWTAAVPLTLVTAGRYLIPGTSVVDLPVLPMLNDGHAPALTMVRIDTRSRTRSVLHLWPAAVALSDGGSTPVLLGAIDIEAVIHPLSMTTIAVRIDKTTAARIEDLLLILPHAVSVQGQHGSLILAHP